MIGRIRYLVETCTGGNASEFARRIDYSQSLIAAILSGKCEASDRFLKSVTQEFKVRPEWLRTGEGSIFQLAEKPDPRANRAAAEEYFRSLIASLPPEAQADVKEFFLALISDPSNLKKGISGAAKAAQISFPVSDRDRRVG